MSRIQFDYALKDNPPALWFTALERWTWKDYHAVVQVAQIRVMYASGPIDVVVDLSATGEPFPIGLRAHSRTFNKRHSEALSGRGVVIGAPNDQLATLGLDDSGTMHTPHGPLVFVADEAAALAVLQAWHAPNSAE